MDNNEMMEPFNPGSIRSVNINEEMRGSYLDYAMSVIVSRALPDARDGLKPVHRRILYAMHDMGLRSNTSHKKSARIVGEVLGKYHPHGDSAVYDAMVRMAQDFSLRYPLVDGQGNFGSIDGDSAAAMRYTEARMASLAEELLVDINMDTVDFVENYDGSQEEPSVLPARLPNLLLNGASGIAVGMATNIPPHNLRELSQAINYIIDNYHNVDDITVDDLMEFVKGPDFPTGASIIVGDDLKEAYATGKGRVAMRSEATIEEGRNDSFRIVVTSIPYQISKTAIVERIVSLVRDGRLDQIRDLRDESDREGLRLVIELKRFAQPNKVLNQLYKFTQLQSYFNIQMLALVDNEPRNLSLKRALTIYIEHRYDVIVRRSEYELRKLRARAHILMGLLKAVSNIDAVIQTIRASDDVDTARQQLISRFELDELQANAILDMQLRRLAALERQKLQNEYDEVQARITYLENLLSSPQEVLELIREDVNTLAEKYGDERQTIVVQGNADFDDDDLVREENVVIALTKRGYIKRVPARTYREQRRGGRGVIGMQLREEDMLLDVFFCSTLDTILFFSSKGKVYSERAFRVPETGRTSRGMLIHSMLPLDADEVITAVLSVDSFEMEDTYFVMLTEQGRIKRVDINEFSAIRPSGLVAMSIPPDDTLGWVKYSRADEHILIATRDGQSIRFEATQVRPMRRQATGVNAIRLLDDDIVVAMDIVRTEQTHVLVVTDKGFGKRTPIDQYNVQARFGMGARTIARDERIGNVVAMRCVEAEGGLVLISRNGIVLRTRVEEIRESGRGTMGVTIMNIGEGDEVVGFTLAQDDVQEDSEQDENAQDENSQDENAQDENAQGDVSSQ
jgi:DNA gyrase subunit A